MKKKLLFVFNPKSGKGLIKEHLVKYRGHHDKGRIQNHHLSYTVSYVSISNRNVKKAKAGHYAVGQFNINNLEWTKSEFS